MTMGLRARTVAPALYALATALAVVIVFGAICCSVWGFFEQPAGSLFEIMERALHGIPDNASPARRIALCRVSRRRHLLYNPWSEPL